MLACQSIFLLLYPPPPPPPPPSFPLLLLLHYHLHRPFLSPGLAEPKYFCSTGKSNVVTPVLYNSWASSKCMHWGVWGGRERGWWCNHGNGVIPWVLIDYWELGLNIYILFLFTYISLSLSQSLYLSLPPSFPPPLSLSLSITHTHSHSLSLSWYWSWYLRISAGPIAQCCYLDTQVNVTCSNFVALTHHEYYCTENDAIFLLFIIPHVLQGLFYLLIYLHDSPLISILNIVILYASHDGGNYDYVNQIVNWEDCQFDSIAIQKINKGKTMFVLYKEPVKNDWSLL